MPLVVFKWKRYAMQKSRKFEVDQRGKRQTVLPLAGLLLVYSTKPVGLWILLIQIKSPLGKGHILVAQKGLWGVESIFPRATLWSQLFQAVDQSVRNSENSIVRREKKSSKDSSKVSWRSKGCVGKATHWLRRQREHRHSFPQWQKSEKKKYNWVSRTLKPVNHRKGKSALDYFFYSIFKKPT